MEGLRQLDEFNVIRDKLPPPHARLMIPQPLGRPLRDLSKEELDVFQLVLNEGSMEGVFNKSISTDLDTGSLLQKLLKAGYIESDS